MRNAILFLMLLCCSVANAEVKLVINGPEKGKSGDLIVINSTGSIADVQSWIIPDRLIGKTLMGCGEQVGFATREAGSYTFYLYGSDGENLAHTSHTVVISSDGVKPPPIDPDPVDPTPPPVGNFDSLKKTSYDKSKLLNDPSTRTRLGQNLSQSSFGDTLTASQLQVESLITKALASRSRDQQDADWFNGWYIPILQEIRSLNKSGQLKTVSQYNQAIAAVVAGLKQ